MQLILFFPAGIYVPPLVWMMLRCLSVQTMGTWCVHVPLVVPELPRCLLVSPRVIHVVHVPDLLVQSFPALVHSDGRKDGRAPPPTPVSLVVLPILLLLMLRLLVVRLGLLLRGLLEVL